MSELLNTIRASHVDINKYNGIYYTEYLEGMILALSYLVRADNPNAFFKRYAEGVRILHTKETAVALKKGEFKNLHPIYKAVLKTRCYFLVCLFHIAVKIKHTLFGSGRSF